MAHSIIITDLDNTLYNWVDYYCRVFRGVLHALSKETGEEEDILLANFQRVFVEQGVIEYPYAVQELDICRGKPADYVEKLVLLSKGVSRRVRDANLKAYYGVRETLEWAVKEGIRVVGLTNAAYYDAEARLKYLHIDHLFTGLAAWEGLDPPTHYPWTPKYYPWLRIYKSHRRMQNVTQQRKKRLQYRWMLPIHELKPSTYGILKVINDLQVLPEQTYVIGDNLYKDIAPANSVGAVSIWARYGTEMNFKEFQTLLGITTWSKEQISVVYDYDTIEPMYTISSFPEIRRIASPYYQLRLSFATEQNNISEINLSDPNSQPQQLELDLPFINLNDNASLSIEQHKQVTSRFFIDTTQPESHDQLLQLSFTDFLTTS